MRATSRCNAARARIWAGGADNLEIQVLFVLQCKRYSAARRRATPGEADARSPGQESDWWDSIPSSKKCESCAIAGDRLLFRVVDGKCISVPSARVHGSPGTGTRIADLSSLYPFPCRLCVSYVRLGCVSVAQRRLRARYAA